MYKISLIKIMDLSREWILFLWSFDQFLSVNEQKMTVIKCNKLSEVHIMIIKDQSYFWITITFTFPFTLNFTLRKYLYLKVINMRE